MKSSTPRILLLTAVLGVTAAGGLGGQDPSPAPRDRDVVVREEIAPGVQRLGIRRGDFQAPPGSDRWTIHVLLLDPSKARIELGIAMDEIVGAETTSSIAGRRGALAAVNGGYFRTTGLLRGEPAGLMAVGGRLLSEPYKGRASLAVSNTGDRTALAVAHIRIKSEIRVSGGGGAAPIDGVNRDRGPEELIVFTPEFHRTTLTGPEGIEAVCLREDRPGERDAAAAPSASEPWRGRVVDVRDGAGSAAIPEKGLVVSARGAGAAWVRAQMKAGTAVEMTGELISEPALPFRPDFIVGGGPRLLSGGRSVPAEAGGYPADFYAKRHPRTAVGSRVDGAIVLVVVDGRQPKLSVGMSIPELAVLMAELGCVEAINLDGGGSTTLVVRGAVVNSPSDAAGERPVSDALLIFPR